MPRKKGTRGPQGGGTIRKKTVTRKGQTYTYWEARLTVGRDPGTGKQIQRSFTAKTQKEVREKLQAAAVTVNENTYIPPQKFTVGRWLDTWAADYLGDKKPATVRIYKNNIEKHIKPALGAVKLQDLCGHMIQEFINGVELAPASVRLAYKVLHMALEKAVELRYLPRNPADRCVLPKLEQKEIIPLTDEQSAALLEAARGNPLEYLVTVALFTGCRLSELLGLTWDAVDYKKGTLAITKQLALKEFRAESIFLLPKNGKPRTIAPASAVFTTLRKQWRKQAEFQLRAGPVWENVHNLVFTNEIGSPLEQNQVNKRFKALTASAGLSDTRFHDLRHTYAVNAIRAGDDLKTLQGNLGHASAAFTLNRYGHFTEQMKMDSAARMEAFIQSTFIGKDA